MIFSVAVFLVNVLKFVVGVLLLMEMYHSPMFGPIWRSHSLQIVSRHYITSWQCRCSIRNVLKKILFLWVWRIQIESFIAKQRMKYSIITSKFLSFPSHLSLSNFTRHREWWHCSSHWSSSTVFRDDVGMVLVKRSPVRIHSTYFTFLFSIDFG